jgi:hypothetical protein
VVDAKRSATELPIPGLENLEAILDLCAFQDGRGFAPTGILVGGDGIVLVMEAVDRSKGGAKVLRVVRLAR